MKAEAVIEQLKDKHAKDQKNEIFEDDEHIDGKKFNEMRETKTGFGAKAQYKQEGGLQPGDESEEDEEEDGIDQDDEEDEESDHNF